MNAYTPRETTVGPPGRPGGRVEPSPLALFSPFRHAFFQIMFARHCRRHMRALRVARWGLPDAALTDPAAPRLVVFANHPSWWDGAAFMLLSARLFPRRRMFVPMEAAALARYRFMRRIGVFGVDTGTPRGTVAFMRTAAEILQPDPPRADAADARPRSRMLWINAPGRFADARERPLPIVPGLVRFAELAPGARFVPLALEYPFWSERAPEMLAAFGPPIAADTLLALDREDRAAHLAAALEATMDRLAEDAQARDPARFVTVLRGAEGVGGTWQLWRRLGALLRGQRFDPRHDPSERPAQPRAPAPAAAPQPRAGRGTATR